MREKLVEFVTKYQSEIGFDDAFLAGQNIIRQSTEEEVATLRVLLEKEPLLKIKKEIRGKIQKRTGEVIDAINDNHETRIYLVELYHEILQSEEAYEFIGQLPTLTLLEHGSSSDVIDAIASSIKLYLLALWDYQWKDLVYFGEIGPTRIKELAGQQNYWKTTDSTNIQ